MALTTMYPGINNSPKTELTAQITAADTSITVRDSSVLPEAPNLAVLGSNAQAEVVIYSGKNGNILTGCVRGSGGTTARSWPEDTVVARNFTLLDYNNLCENIRDLDSRKRDSTSSVSLADDITGTLPVANGGTGQTTLEGVKTWLGLAAMAFKAIVNLASDVTGTLPVANGGTGQTSLQAARNAMGLGNTTGVLPVANGGTGLSASPSMLTNLGSTTAANVMAASPRPGITGTLPAANGGTGQTSLQATRNAMGLGNTTGALPVANGGSGLTASPSMLTNLASTTAANVMAASPRPGVTGTLPVGNGGTGATSAANARTNLGITAIATRPNYTVSTTDPGVNSTLNNGTIYFVI